MRRRARARYNPGRPLPVLDEEQETDAPLSPQEVERERGKTPAERGELLRRPGDPRQPFTVSYGMGVDSTAMLVALVRSYRRQRDPSLVPGLILFADTGGEMPHTYAYLPVIQRYLADNGFPPVTVVRKIPARSTEGYGVYETLEGQTLIQMDMPAMSYGRHGCSLKWKKEPQEQYRRYWEPARRAWLSGLSVVNAIGYDNGPADLRRSKRLDEGDEECGEAEGIERYQYWYPLQDLGWARRRCKVEIAAEGLPVPRKSSCFFCPSMQAWEARRLIREHPELAERVIEMEERAKPFFTKKLGLWRSEVKGTHGSDPHPESFSEYAKAIRSQGRWEPPATRERPPQLTEEAAKALREQVRRKRGPVQVPPYMRSMLPEGIDVYVAPGLKWSRDLPARTWSKSLREQEWFKRLGREDVPPAPPAPASAPTRYRVSGEALLSTLQEIAPHLVPFVRAGVAAGRLDCSGLSDADKELMRMAIARKNPRRTARR